MDQQCQGKNTTLSKGQCECGHAQFEVKGKALLRGYCHCTICQEFNQASHADITLFRAKDVVMPKEGSVEYKAYASPPLVQRGKCTVCHKPAIEYVAMPLMPKLVVIPTANIQNSSQLPEPKMHIFYHSRTADVDDDLPKYQGYLKSQVAFFGGLLKGYFR